MTMIPCTEGRVVVASAADGIDFGAVNSCMTISCILDDGSKIAAHDAIFKRVQPQILFALKERVPADRQIARVIAAGAGTCWTPTMESQQELASGMSKADPSFKEQSWQEQDRLMFPNMITRNVARFTEVLSRDLGVAAGAVEFRDVAEGKIKLNPDGTLEVEEAPD